MVRGSKDSPGLGGTSGGRDVEAGAPDQLWLLVPAEGLADRVGMRPANTRLRASTPHPRGPTDNRNPALLSDMNPTQTLTSERHSRSEQHAQEGGKSSAASQVRRASAAFSVSRLREDHLHRVAHEPDLPPLEPHARGQLPVLEDPALARVCQPLVEHADVPERLSAHCVRRRTERMRAVACIESASGERAAVAATPLPTQEKQGAACACCVVAIGGADRSARASGAMSTTVTKSNGIPTVGSLWKFCGCDSPARQYCQG